MHSINVIDIEIVVGAHFGGPEGHLDEKIHFNYSKCSSLGNK